jgi:nucleoid-associated protein YgaU
MAWGKRVAIAAVMVTIGSAALADPAGTPSFVPVAYEEGPPAGGSVVVQPGDHLWKISERHLEGILERPAQLREIVPYWLAVIEANRGRLTSGDPDLIYPGEGSTLPMGPEVQTLGSSLDDRSTDIDRAPRPEGGSR